MCSIGRPDSAAAFVEMLMGGWVPFIPCGCKKRHVFHSSHKVYPYSKAIYNTNIYIYSKKSIAGNVMLTLKNGDFFLCQQFKYSHVSPLYIM